MNSHKKFFLIALMFLLIIGCARQKLHTERQLFMGTIVEVISPYQEAAQIAFDEIERVENIFSTYKKDSAMSHLNKTGFLNTNFEITFLIEKAKKFSALSNGQFDITVGPLTKIWKEAFLKKELPQERDIKEAIKIVGFDKIYIDRENNTIKLMEKGMQVDLGAIAKGYAVDLAIKELKRRGIDSAIVNAGGDMYCLGSKFGKPWKIGLQHPRKRQKLMTTLELTDMAVVTSGDYEQYFEVGQKRYSHIIDPKTGYPIDNDVISVTVMAKDALTADAVSTCVFILGKDQGLEVFKNYPGIEKIIVITKQDVQDN